MMYAFVDSNILIRVVSQGRPGCELQRFEDLVALAEGGVIRVLVPEVLMLELEKHFRLLPRQFESQCDKVTHSLTKATEDAWNEIDALKLGLLDQVAGYKTTKIAECEQMTARIMEFLRSTFIQSIPLTNDIWLDTQRRLIAGRMPNSKGSADQDASIIASIVAFFRQAKDQEARLLFCSENVHDFAVECKSDAKDRLFALHPLIQSDLPHARYFVNLETMLAFAKGYEALPEPNDEQIELAVNMRDLHDFDSDEYWTFQKIVDERFAKQVADRYATEIAPSLPIEVNSARGELATAIHEQLRQCRGCPTWNERSEDKLPAWLEFVPESLVPYTSLPNMVRIRRNLEEYLRRHRET